MVSIEIFDDRFRRYIIGNTTIELLASGFRWTEGPVWFGDAGHLLFSDIPNNRIMRWTEEGVSIFRQPSGYSNGHTRDREGRLITCEHGGRRISRTELDGHVVAVVDNFDGKKLNSPNDVVVRSDGSIWFTDPPYGIQTDYEGNRAESETGQYVVYRYEPRSDKLAVICDEAVHPNGLAFSPDERTLYVADTGMPSDPAPRGRIFALDVADDGQSLSRVRIFADISSGYADGLRCDEEGNLWTSAGAGINCYQPDGTLLGRIGIPETVANVTFGGPKKNRLFICASTSLYAIYVNTRGAQVP